MTGRSWLLLLFQSTLLDSAPVIENLALGRVPFGSSHTYGFSFIKATDGDLESEWRSRHNEPPQPKPQWRVPEPPFGQAPAWRVPEWRLPYTEEMAGDYPSFLLVDLGAPCHIDSMRIHGASSNTGFKTLKSYHSLDALNWTFVRSDDTNDHCNGNITSVHNGWTEETRYVLIQMEDRCAGIHMGSIGLSEWEVLGWHIEDMVMRFAKSWPHCTNLGMCFSFVDLDHAKASCMSDPDCDGFSFSAGSMSGGRGGGCYKTNCSATPTGDDQAPGPKSNLGRGSHGYWEKRRMTSTPEKQRLVEVTKQLFTEDQYM